MDDRKMQIIKQLMEELEAEMDMGADDFSSRLGKEMPPKEVEVSIESEMPMEDEEMLEEGPEEKLKSRLLKMRG
jgi:hypothetical protein